MTVRDAIELLQTMNPDAQLVVPLFLDEDVKAGMRQRYHSINSFYNPSEDTVTYIDTLVMQEKTTNVVAIRF